MGGGLGFEPLEPSLDPPLNRQQLLLVCGANIYNMHVHNRVIQSSHRGTNPTQGFNLKEK